MKTSTMDTVGTAAAKTSIAASSSTAVLSFVTHDMLLGIIGLIFTLLTFLMSMYYKNRADRRAELESLQRIRVRDVRIALWEKALKDGSHPHLPKIPKKPIEELALVRRGDWLLSPESEIGIHKDDA